MKTEPVYKEILSQMENFHIQYLAIISTKAETCLTGNFLLVLAILYLKFLLFFYP